MKNGLEIAVGLKIPACCGYFLADLRDRQINGDFSKKKVAELGSLKNQKKFALLGLISTVFTFSAKD